MVSVFFLSFVFFFFFLSGFPLPLFDCRLLNAFILSLPAQTVVFGMTLTALMERDNLEVPRVVEQCIAEIERRGMTEEGIYRLSGSSLGIQELKQAYDSSSEGVDLSKPQWHDINLISGTLKLFFRELADPVISFEFYSQFMEALGQYFPPLFFGKVINERCLLMLQVSRITMKNCGG